MEKKIQKFSRWIGISAVFFHLILFCTAARSESGTLQKPDCLSVHFTEAHYTDLFTFSLNGPTNTFFSAKSEQEGLCLYLYDLSSPSGAELIASRCDNTYPFAPRIPWVESTLLLGSGTYSLELTTYDRKEEVSYTLSASVELTQVDCSSYSYPGILQESDCRSAHYSDAHYADLYHFDLSTPQMCVFDVSSEQEGVCLYLYDWSQTPGAELIGSSCDDTYPFIAKISKYLGAGTYSLELATDDPDISLEYDFVSSVELSSVACSSFSYPGAVLESDWTSSHYSEAHYMDFFNFALSSPTMVALDGLSQQDGLCLYLYDWSRPFGAEVIASSCDDYFPFNPKINNYLAAGAYSLEIVADDLNTALEYTAHASVELNQIESSLYSYQGTVQAIDLKSALYLIHTHFADFFYFTLNEPAVLVLDAASEQNGVCLCVYDQNKPPGLDIVAATCDDVYKFRAKINKYLSAGTYKLELAANDLGITLSYTLLSSLPLNSKVSISSNCPVEQVLGSESPYLESLRMFRDTKLATSSMGRKIIELYYTYAEDISAFYELHPYLRAGTRRVLEEFSVMIGKK